MIFNNFWRKIVENGKAYLNASEVNKLFGTNLSGVVDLTNFGNYSVYYDDGVLAVSKKEISLLLLFSPK